MSTRNRHLTPAERRELHEMIRAGADRLECREKFNLSARGWQRNVLAAMKEPALRKVGKYLQRAPLVAPEITVPLSRLMAGK